MKNYRKNENGNKKRKKHQAKEKTSIFTMGDSMVKKLNGFVLLKKN